MCHLVASHSQWVTYCYKTRLYIPPKLCIDFLCTLILIHIWKAILVLHIGLVGRSWVHGCKINIPISQYFVFESNYKQVVADSVYTSQWWLVNYQQFCLLHTATWKIYCNWSFLCQTNQFIYTGTRIDYRISAHMFGPKSSMLAFYVFSYWAWIKEPTARMLVWKKMILFSCKTALFCPPLLSVQCHIGTR